MSLLFNNLKKRIHPQSRSFERRICALDLQIFKKFNMSQMNSKEVFHNTAKRKEQVFSTNKQTVRGFIQLYAIRNRLTRKLLKKTEFGIK